MRSLSSVVLMVVITMSMVLPTVVVATPAKALVPSPEFVFSGYHDLPGGSYEYLSVVFRGSGDPLTFSSLDIISVYWYEHTSQGIYQMAFGPYYVSGGEIFGSSSFPSGSGQFAIGTSSLRVAVKGAFTGFNPAMATRAVLAGSLVVDDDGESIVSGVMAVMLTGTSYFDSNTELGLGSAHWNPQGMMTRLFILSPQTLSAWEYEMFASSQTVT